MLEASELRRPGTAQEKEEEKEQEEERPQWHDLLLLLPLLLSRSASATGEPAHDELRLRRCIENSRPISSPTVIPDHG
ncbi:MAG: hypothetical protein HYY18_08265 [Planctomycetes bacterium]|nr:hypothetical protein [Planctomycetota bacterium]